MILIKWALDKCFNNKYNKNHEYWENYIYGNSYHTLGIQVIKREDRRNMRLCKQLLHKSICICPICFTTNKNMIYNPEKETWYCIYCYRTLKKKRRLITIKDPRLQKIRNNLMLLLLKWKSRQWNQLHDIYAKIRFDENRNVRDLSDNEQQQVKDLRKRMNEIDRIVNHSICKCTTCSQTDKDMYYNPFTARWYCVECVINYSETYFKYHRDLSKKPWDVDEDEMEFLKSFTYSG